MAKVKIEDTMGVFLEASSLSPEEPVTGEERGTEETAPDVTEKEEAVEAVPDTPRVEEDPAPEPSLELEKKTSGRRRTIKPAPEPESEPETEEGGGEPDHDLEDGSIEEVVQFIEKFALLKSNQLPLFSSVLSTGVMAMEAATREELSALENQQKALQRDLETVKRRRDALAEVKKIIERKN